jgi:type IV secretory pathway VirJ component
MARYLLERFLPAPGAGMPLSLEDAALAAHAGVRLLQTIYVPDDEVCFYLLESDSLELAQQAGRDAGLSVERMHLVETGGENPADSTTSLTDRQAAALARRVSRGTTPGGTKDPQPRGKRGP